MANSPAPRPSRQANRAVPAHRRQARPPSPPAEPVEDLAALAREHAVAAIDAMVEILTSSPNDNARLAAAKALLEIGYGRPGREIEEAGPADIRITWVEPRDEEGRP